MTTIVSLGEFNVRGQNTAYRQFIEGLRPRMAERDRYSHNLPVLHLQENPPIHWFDLILRISNTIAITLRIRRGNLYLDGYRMGTSSGTWWEFGSSTTNPPSPRLIPGSSFLGFTSDYKTLATVADLNKDDIMLGQQPLIGAVNTLANTSTNSRSKARPLIIVIRMICESIRFARISSHISITANYTAQSGFKPEPWMDTLESNWGQLSYDLLAIDANPLYKFRPLRISATEIQTVEQAVNILAVVLRQPVIVSLGEFNVRGQNTAYRQFIEGLRPRMAERDRYSHNLPVLHLQENPPIHWFDLILRTSNTIAITLRIRRGNLYLDGYRMGTSSGAWWEFGSSTTNPPSTQLIPGSSFLGFTGDYGSLANAAVLNKDDIKLGQQPLIDAVDTLANTATNSRSKAGPLIIVIRMICESIRFARISSHITANYTAQSSFKPESWMDTLESNWGHLSYDLLAIDANPLYKFRPLRISATEIQTVEQAATILAVVLRQPVTRGQSLVEVFSVRINDIAGSLYGTITVTDGLGSQYIYYRENEDSEAIHHGDNVSLTRPARSISAYDSFTINLALMDKNTGHEVSKGQISWNVYNTTNEYDKLLSEDVHGEYGSVTVNYAVLSDAVKATVEVTHENEAADNIYGRLTASNGVSEFENVLFRKTKVEKDIDVRAGESTRLSRFVVAVPLNSALTVTSDDEIAKTTAHFPTQLAGTSEKIISGKHGEIKVKVTWND